MTKIRLIFGDETLFATLEGAPAERDFAAMPSPTADAKLWKRFQRTGAEP